MRFIRDPLVLFLIAGAAIYGLASYTSSEDASYDITVSSADVQRLSDQWQMQMRRPPTEGELEGLIEHHIKEEIYYREAQRLRIDENDTIVRRRLVQKLTFINEDLATAGAFTQEELKAYFGQHRERYRVPARFSFEHRYFSSDRRSEAEADARAALADPERSGDPFMLQTRYVQRSEREIGDLFGRDFARSLSRLEPGAAWQGPIQSAYGWHPVRVGEALPSRLPEFEEVATRVANDAQQSRREDANEAYFEELKSRYAVIYEQDVAGR